MIKGILKTAIILALLLPLCGSAFGGVVGTDGVEVYSTVEETILFGPVLDDFNDGGMLNNWGHKTGSFSDGGASCANSRDSTFPKEGAFCLKLVYNVSPSESYAGYWSLLGGENLSDYTTISFWVKGTMGGELFKVELKNSSTAINRSTATVYVTDYLDGGVTTSWQEVTIPFHNFVNLDSWKNMVELVFTFENSQSVTNASPRQGTVYIDKISFSTTTVNEVRVDYFGDKIGTCALGGNIGDMGNVSHSFTEPFQVYVSSPCALESTYNVPTRDSWGGHFIVFGGGTTTWTAISHDFSAYNYVSVCIKAKSATENPKVIKMEIIDNSDKPYPARPIYITTSWQRYVIPLSYLVDAGLKKTSIKMINFIYEGWRIEDAAGYNQGALYIDNLRFDVDTE